jgi:hypothetical protein
MRHVLMLAALMGTFALAVGCGDKAPSTTGGAGKGAPPSGKPAAAPPPPSPPPR